MAFHSPKPSPSLQGASCPACQAQGLMTEPGSRLLRLLAGWTRSGSALGQQLQWVAVEGALQLIAGPFTPPAAGRRWRSLQRQWLDQHQCPIPAVATIGEGGPAAATWMGMSHSQQLQRPVSTGFLGGQEFPWIDGETVRAVMVVGTPALVL